MASSARIIQSSSAWFQKKINLRPQHRGVHLVTEEILREVPELLQFAIGICHVQSKLPEQLFFWVNFIFLTIASFPPAIPICCPPNTASLSQ